MSFLHLSQIEKFYKNRSLLISKQKPSTVSIDDLISTSMQLLISELGHRIESTVKEEKFDEEAEAILEVIEILKSEEVSSLFGFDLGETVVLCEEFMNRISFPKRYAIHLSTAHSGQVFFNSPSIAYLDCGTSMVVDSYKRAVKCASRADRDDSFARNSILTVKQNVETSKNVYSMERRLVSKSHAEMAEVLKECKKLFNQ